MTPIPTSYLARDLYAREFLDAEPVRPESAKSQGGALRPLLALAAALHPAVTRPA